MIMAGTDWSGPTLSLVAGVLSGSTFAPMKRIKNWPWENWFLIVVFAYACSPWTVAALSIHDLTSVYRLAGHTIVLETLFLGMAWGFSVVLAGKGFDLVGYSISTALRYGLSISLGSLGALFLIDRMKLFSSAGLKILIWDTVLLLGVGLCAQASHLRETPIDKFRPAGHDQLKASRFSARLGIVCSLLAGVFSTLLNIALTNGEPIRRQAIALGSDPNWAANAIWSLAVSASSIPTIVWCSYLVTRKSSWSVYRKPHARANFLLCVVMAGLWIAGTVLYGVSSARMGRLGPAVSWPLYMTSLIITGNLWGWAWSEWGGASARSVRLFWSGVAVQVLGIVLLSASQ